MAEPIEVSKLERDELRGLAERAAADRDPELLWQITQHYMALHGQAGALVSPNTLRTYRIGVQRYLRYVHEQDAAVLDPGHDFGAAYVRSLEQQLAPTTVRVRLAAVRALYRSLRWTRSTPADPFVDVKAARDRTAPWDKRQPYSEEDVERLMLYSVPQTGSWSRDDLLNRLLLLLGAHAGLRVSETVSLTWGQVEQAHVRIKGKGRKKRRVDLSGTLQETLQQQREVVGKVSAADKVLPWRSEQTTRDRLKGLCELAGVVYLAYHSLRHYAGTRLYKATRSLDAVARFLGHSQVETARIYAVFADSTITDVVSQW